MAIDKSYPNSEPDVPAAYDLWAEAQRIIDAIEPRRGSHMTLMCALHEAWTAGVERRRPVWRFSDACIECGQSKPAHTRDDIGTCEQFKSLRQP